VNSFYPHTADGTQVQTDWNAAVDALSASLKVQPQVVLDGLIAQLEAIPAP
jgi:hypothetical protein